MRSRLPHDLAALGDDLEAAVGGALARRRARRTSFLNAVATVMVAAPLAVGVAASDLTPSSSPPPADGSPPIAALAWIPGLPAATAHIPDENVVTLREERCLDANDCRSPQLFVLEEPPGKL